MKSIEETIAEIDERLLSWENEIVELGEDEDDDDAVVIWNIQALVTELRDLKEWILDENK